MQVNLKNIFLALSLAPCLLQAAEAPKKPTPPTGKKPGYVKKVPVKKPVAQQNLYNAFKSVTLDEQEARNIVHDYRILSGSFGTDKEVVDLMIDYIETHNKAPQKLIDKMNQYGLDTDTVIQKLYEISKDWQ